MTMADTTRTYRLRSDVRFRSVADEGVVLRQDEGEVLVVNGVGVRVVELVADGAGLEDMLGILENEYEVEPADLRTDVKTYLEELEEAGVLESTS